MRRLVRFVGIVVVLGLCAVTADSAPPAPAEDRPFQNNTLNNTKQGRHPVRSINTESMTTEEVRALLAPQRPTPTKSSGPRITPPGGATATRRSSEAEGSNATKNASSREKSDVSIQSEIASKSKKEIRAAQEPYGTPYRVKPEYNPPASKSVPAQTQSKDRAAVVTPSGFSGENIADAIPISNLPFSASGSTVGFADDYDETCPFVSDGAPDVVYAYTPLYPQMIEVSLCGSSFDTELFIYENVVTQGLPYACNDDFCGFQSFLTCLSITPGNTYYFIVDGYNGALGAFSLDIYSCLPGERADNPIVLSPAPTVVFGNTDSYTEDLFDCVGASGAHDVFYSYTPFVDEIIRINTCGSAYDTKLLVYEDVVVPGNPIWCNDDACGLQSNIGCFPVLAGHTYFIVVDGFQSFSNGAYQLTVERCCAACPEPSVDEGEGCADNPEIDNFNGGCNSFPEIYSAIVPGLPVCGEASFDGTWRDTDWYRTAYPLVEGDSVTWCVTANFPFHLLIIDQSGGCLTRLLGETFAAACDTAYTGFRVDVAGNYSFFVAPDFSTIMACVTGPWVYNAVLYRDEACVWSGCLPGGTPEGETCFESEIDSYNGGCNYVPAVYQPISPGQSVCGHAWYSLVNGQDFRDTDWYSYSATGGEEVVWCVRSEVLSLTAILDVTAGCYTIIDLANGPACEWATLTYTPPSDAELVFYVAPDFSVGPTMPCATGPWEYDAFLNPGPQCAWAGCNGSINFEQEPCIDDLDLMNPGCGSFNGTPIYTDIIPDVPFCGTAHLGPNVIDYDWYLFYLNAGDIVRIDWSASYLAEFAAIDLTNGCNSAVTLDYAISDPCTPAILQFVAPSTGPYSFASGPYFFGNPPLNCTHGPWEYTALITACQCPCFADPHLCDGDLDIQDVITAIDVVFRGDPPIVDPSPNCPYQPIDVDCNGETQIFDVLNMIDVAFRGESPTTEFCEPCPMAAVASSGSTVSVPK